MEGNIGTYIATATDLIGLNFVGLSAGPRNLESDVVMVLQVVLQICCSV